MQVVHAEQTVFREALHGDEAKVSPDAHTVQLLQDVAVLPLTLL